MPKYIINVDLARVSFTMPPDPDAKNPEERKKERTGSRTLGWGDEVDIRNPAEDITDDEVRVKWTAFRSMSDGSVKALDLVGVIKGGKSISGSDIVVPKSKSKVLKIDFVDVQQGDGAVIETPDGKVILIDGGDNQLFARYLANRFRGSTADKPKTIDCILVTHGDADHFSGLAKIRDSEGASERWKRLFISPQRVYHNGLVKRPEKIGSTKLKDVERLGKTVSRTDPETNEEVLLITELEDNLLDVGVEKMNGPFQRWREDLLFYQQRLPKKKKIEFRRLKLGDKAFEFISGDDPKARDAGIKIDVLAPITTTIGGAEGLKFLRNPPKGPRTSEEFTSLEDKKFSKTYSASHTINGHSIVFRLRYGGFTFMFSGDLNDEAERILTKAHNRNEINLQSEVFKVPHHGSHDFSGAFVAAVAPIISIISSGDESERKEYIHPRATILGALGRYSRIDEPIIFITELVAFFKTEGWFRKRFHQLTEAGTKAVKAKADVVEGAEDFYAFSRAAFGLVMVRTDGERLLVYTNSALERMKEAYVFKMDEFGKPEPVALRRV
jgi:beta-lactamase superfamily II metal-dependent hydrolase